MIYSANYCLSLRLFRWFLFSLIVQSLVQVTELIPSVRGDEQVKLKDDRITESSGLEASLRTPGHFWTHNDSGDDAVLYAFNHKGHKTGRAKLSHVQAVDWEDLAAFTFNDQPWLVVADCGDNALRRSSVTLHFVPEPDPEQKDSKVDSLPLVCKYPEGAMNCEAIAVDSQRNQIWLVTKSALPYAVIYTLPLPDLSRPTDWQSREITLTRAGVVAIPMVTAMTIDSMKQEVILINYLCAFRYSLSLDKPWWQTEATLFELPKLKQIEAIAVTPDHNWWITSEGSPCVLTTIDQTRPQATSAGAKAK